MAPEALPAAWRATALDPPAAHGGPPASGALRTTAEDFCVEELLSFEPDGGAVHLLLRVEKRDANTLFVARALARAAGVRHADIGFAGLKDRRAVALQWFSVPAGPAAAQLAALQGDGFAVQEAHPHSRKLRRGALAGNRFRLRVRDLAGDLALLGERLRTLAERGAPNYFGPQRFGAGGSNLDRVWDWLQGDRLPRGREPRGFLLSTARALAFNTVLADRVAAGDWDRLLPGEVVSLDGSGSVFAATAIDAALAARCAAGELHPSGPLPGEGGMAPGGEAGLREAAALASCAPLAAQLAGAGLQAGRRALRLIPREFEFDIAGNELRLAFRLGRGCYATALLREAVASAQPVADAD